MTIRRERLERRAERREDWCQSAERRSDEAYARSRSAIEPIPVGQPVLVGHHSERKHRRALDRADSALRQSAEQAQKAKRHAQVARTLRGQLDRSIFSDDDNAIEVLEEKARQLTAAADQANAINKAWRKGGRELVAEKFGEKRAAQAVESAAAVSWRAKKPFDATNIRAEARRCVARIADLKSRAERKAKAEATGGVTLEGEGHLRVTFAEKPDYSVIRALKSAGFRWAGGSWFGPRSKLPQQVTDIVESAQPQEH